MNLGNKINLGSSTIKVGLYWQKYLFKTAVHTVSSITRSDQVSYSFFGGGGRRGAKFNIRTSYVFHFAFLISTLIYPIVMLQNKKPVSHLEQLYIIKSKIPVFQFLLVGIRSIVLCGTSQRLVQKRLWKEECCSVSPIFHYTFLIQLNCT